MYRPLFIDAPGLFGLVVSFENLILLYMTFLLCTKRFIRSFNNHRNSFFLRLNLFYLLSGAIILSSTTANLGIAVRQKTMLLPSFIIIVMMQLYLKFSQKKQCQE
jgi:hypothetical protein